MSKQDRKYVKNYGGVIWREKRKGKKYKLEQALNTRTGKLIYPLQKQQVSESLSRGDRKGKRESERKKKKHLLLVCCWWAYFWHLPALPINRQVWQLTCVPCICWIPRHQSWVSLQLALFDFQIWLTIGTILKHIHTHTPQSLQSESTIQLPNNVIVKIRQVNQRIRWYKINYATSLLLFQTTLARFAYSPLCITYTYVSTILHKWFSWSGSPNKCDKNLI